MAGVTKVMGSAMAKARSARMAQASSRGPSPRELANRVQAGGQPSPGAPGGGATGGASNALGSTYDQSPVVFTTSPRSVGGKSLLGA